MKFLRVDLEENRGAILVTGFDKLQEVLTEFYSEMAKQKAEGTIQASKKQLSKSGSSLQIQEHLKFSDLSDIKIVLLDKEKDQYLLRIMNSIFMKVDKQREDWLVKKFGLQSVLFSFLVKVRIEPIDGKFTVDFKELLQLLERHLPLKGLNVSEVVANFTETGRYNPYTGTVEPFVIYQDKDLKLSLNFDRATSEQRFPKGCIRYLLDPKDMWQQNGTTITGPFVSLADDKSLPTLVLSVENPKSCFFNVESEPIVGAKAENSARTLSSIVAAAFLMEK